MNEIHGVTPDVELPASRRIYSNRTLNLRAIRAVGFDMDYTLIHYHIEAWERRAYEHARHRLIMERHWPLEQLEFDLQIASRGLVFDTELGNVVKADRFGFVKRASHGTEMLPFDRQRECYLHELVDLSQPRWVFLNTLFSLSEACLYMQCVDLLDRGRLGDAIGYADLYRAIRESVDEAHMMGKLKAEVAADPDVYVELDPEMPRALIDLRDAGKKLLLVTNSEWTYTRDMMAYAIDRFLPRGISSWRELFDVIIVSSRKPRFFAERNPLFEVVDEEGLLRPFTGELGEGAVYLGGDAAAVEAHLGLSGSEILYVGDHIFTDVTISKKQLRWRTALIIRELEAEVEAQQAFAPSQHRLTKLMAEKERAEREQALLRLGLQRLREQRAGGGGEAKARLGELREALLRLDDEIAPLARSAAALVNARWGPIMRSGNDKSQMARQVERYADVYTSRVSNFGLTTPFAYLRAPHSRLPHDDGDWGCTE